MGNPLQSLNCSIRFDNARILSWTMQPGANYPADWTLQMESSRVGGPWEVIADNLQDSCVWVDTRRRNYNKHLNECYRLRLKIPSTGEEWVSEICDAGNHRAYPYSAEAENIVKQVEEAVKESGCTGVLLKRKIWGVKCPLCVDFSGQATVNEHCPRCLGTGIDGGYFPGIPLGIIKDSITMQEAPSQLGFLQGETVQGRCVAYPWINYGDVWCEDYTNNRYVLDLASPSASYKQTHLIYTIKMHKVELNDVLHSDAANFKVVTKGVWQSQEAPGETAWDTELGRL